MFPQREKHIAVSLMPSIRDAVLEIYLNQILLLAQNGLPANLGIYALAATKIKYAFSI